jgi:hypothetical protein
MIKVKVSEIMLTAFHALIAAALAIVKFIKNANKLKPVGA